MEGRIRVAVAGACGRMGVEVVRGICAQGDMALVAAVDPKGEGRDAGEVAGIGPVGVTVRGDLEGALRESGAEVMVDFTTPGAVKENIRVAIECGARPVVGTTGLSEADLKEVDGWLREKKLSGFVAPNFAIGAVLMMAFCKQAARFFPDVEIIELHHERKKDAPSGTSLMTAKFVLEGRTESPSPEPTERFTLEGVRGGNLEGVRIHSVRLPGLVAHQEVIFGGPGQVLTIRHDAISREAFVPGVLIAVRKVKELPVGLTVGLEKLLGI
ncbi:MAG TPA: 4-hydroxy-tetrahydrodipicolinate reductase [Armatimonadetes bacterium]|nr:4-hydroxy-tetrahydrodipicolinate reductase [Armatimonadota bacterium]